MFPMTGTREMTLCGGWVITFTLLALPHSVYAGPLALLISWHLFGSTTELVMHDG